MKRGVLLVVMTLVVAACAETIPVAAPVTGVVEAMTPPPLNEMPEGQTAPDPRPVWEGFDASLNKHDALVAMVRGETDIFARPGENAPVMTMPWTTILGTATVLLVMGEPVDGWAEVMLPIRPNGTTGWVQTADVELYVVEGKLVVDLSDKELTYFVNGEEILTTTVAIGNSRSPTPTGEFFVTDSVTLANPNSPWGPHALGLSARSDVITEFNGGDGIIGIHGTNSPSSIGEAASLGCVRLPNEIITMLHDMVPIGTPVEIRA